MAIRLVKTAMVVSFAPLALFAAFNNLLDRAAVLGVGAGLLLWFAGFMVIGGHWFAMWQSKEWDAVPSAFNLVVVLLLVAIFLVQRDE